MLKGIETVVYNVEDATVAGAWYRKVLGIEPNYDEPYYVGFTVGGDELGLHPYGDDPRPRPGAEGQIAHWTVVDLGAAVAHFIEHGATAHKPAQDVGGGILVASVIDPFGNIIGLIQNPKSPNLGR